MVRPFSKNIDRAIAQQQKVYLADTGLVNQLAQLDSGALFENAVALQLMKNASLNYFQRKGGLEIDFIAGEKTAVEVKETPTPKDLKALKERAGSINLVAKDGASEAIELIAKGLCHEEDGSCGSEATALGYQFKLLSLNPYPEADAQPGQEDYVVKLEYSAVQGN